MAKSKFDTVSEKKQKEMPEITVELPKSEPLTKKDFVNAFNELPKILKNIVFLRFGIGVAVLIAGFIFLFVDKATGFSFSVGLFFFSAILLISGIILTYKLFAGKYITLVGKCSNIELTSVRGKIKYIYLKSENENGEITTLRFPPKDGAKKFNIGDDMVIYIPTKAFIIENDGIYEVNEYYGVDFFTV